MQTTSKEKKLFTTKQMVILAFLSALAYVLMLLHLPFKFLGFLEAEFSDVPALIASMAYGPLAGVVVEFIKNVIKAITATSTGGVGELANFVISSCYVIPVGIIYRKSKTEKSKFFAFAVGIAGFVAAGILVNYYVTVPLYARLFGGMDVVVGVAAKSVPLIKNLVGIVLLGITPFNIAKGVVLSIVSSLVYKVFRQVL